MMLIWLTVGFVGGWLLAGRFPNTATRTYELLKARLPWAKG